MSVQKPALYLRVLLGAKMIAPLAIGQELPPDSPPPAPPPPGADTTPYFPPPPILSPPVFQPAAALDKPAEKPADPGEFKLGPANFRIGFGLQVGMRLQSPKDPEKVDDLWLDRSRLELRLRGEVWKYLGWQVSIFGSARPVDTGAGGYSFDTRLQEAAIQVDAADEFHVWMGRFLVPTDRSNFAGPWFMSIWNYPGVYSVPGKPTVFVGGKTSQVGRDDGGVIWGDIDKGRFKYYAGVFDLDDPLGNPLALARLNLAILGREPGYYQNATYYGEQQAVLAIGASAQYQKEGSSRPRLDAAGEPITDTLGNPVLDLADYFYFNTDLLAEFRLGESGTLTFEGAYNYFDGYTPARHAMLGTVSYLLPWTVGIGKIQPSFRYHATFDADRSTQDAFLTYVVNKYFARVHAGFQRTDYGGGVVGNAIQLGVQAQKM